MIFSPINKALELLEAPSSVSMRQQVELDQLFSEWVSNFDLETESDFDNFISQMVVSSKVAIEYKTVRSSGGKMKAVLKLGTVNRSVQMTCVYPLKEFH